MAQVFLICLSVFTVRFLLLENIHVFFIVRDFLKRADVIIEIYKLLKNNDEVSTILNEKDICVITYREYKIEFSDFNEASVELEQFIYRALKKYEYMKNAGIEDEELEKRKNRIVQICYELRKLRWLKQ